MVDLESGMCLESNVAWALPVATKVTKSVSRFAELVDTLVHGHHPLHSAKLTAHRSAPIALVTATSSCLWLITPPSPYLATCCPGQLHRPPHCCCRHCYRLNHLFRCRLLLPSPPPSPSSPLSPSPADCLTRYPTTRSSSLVLYIYIESFDTNGVNKRGSKKTVTACAWRRGAGRQVQYGMDGAGKIRRMRDNTSVRQRGATKFFRLQSQRVWSCISTRGC